MTSRRRFLQTALALAATPAAFTRCYGPENQSEHSDQRVSTQAKRMGTFEESAKATIEWIKKGKFDLSLLKEVERVKDNLEFELDKEIDFALKRLRERIDRGENKQKVSVRESIEAGGYVLDIHEINSNLAFIFGKVKTQGKVGPYDVYLLEETEIAFSHSVIGTSIVSTCRIYLFDDRIDRGNKLSEPEQWEKIISYGIDPNAVQAMVRNTLSKKEVSWAEFESLAENITQNCNLQPELASMTLLIMRLFYLHQNRGRDEATSRNELRAQVLMHELAHQELNRAMGDEWSAKHFGSGEMFSMLVELSYGLRQYDRLRNIFEYYLNDACAVQEDVLNSKVFKMLAEYALEHPWAGFEKLATGVTEQDLSNMWASALEGFSKREIGKPFRELFDEKRMFDDMQQFIGTIYAQE